MFSIYIKAEMSVADVCLFFVFLDNLSSWTNIHFLRSVFHDHCFQQQRINVLFIVLHYQQWYIWSPLKSSSVFFLHLKQLSDVSKKCTARDLRKEWKKCNSQEPRHENRARVRVTLRRNMKNSMSQLKQKREVSNLFHSLHTLIFRNVTDNKFTSKLSKRAFGDKGPTLEWLSRDVKSLTLRSLWQRCMNIIYFATEFRSRTYFINVKEIKKQGKRLQITSRFYPFILLLTAADFYLLPLTRWHRL